MELSNLDPNDLVRMSVIIKNVFLKGQARDFFVQLNYRKVNSVQEAFNKLEDNFSTAEHES